MDFLIRKPFEYPWLLFIVVTCVNAAIWWKRSEQSRLADPALDQSYRRLILGFVFWGNIPWLVMGVSMVAGATTITSYIGRDADLRNPHVVAWFGVAIVLWLLGTNWLVFRGGAEELVRHPVILNHRNISASTIKTWWLLALAGGVAALAMLYFRTAATS